MVCRTFSALVTSSTKFTSKKNLPPTVTKAKWEGGNLRCLMKRRWVNTADAQCPIATARGRVWGYVGHQSEQHEISYILVDYFRYDRSIARSLNIVRYHVKDECAKFNQLFMVQRKFVISGFVWSNLCLQKHTDFVQTRYLRYGRLVCWTTINLKQRFIFKIID